MYAIVKVGGKQYRVEKGDSLLVDRMPDEEGATVRLKPLLLAPGGKDEAVFGSDALAKVKVEAKVTGHLRGPKIHVLKFKPKQGYKRRQGHRSELTRLEIGDIELLGAKGSGSKKKSKAAAPEAEKPNAAEAKAEEPKSKAKAEEPKSKAKAEEPKSKAKPAEPKSKAKPAEPKSEDTGPDPKKNQGDKLEEAVTAEAKPEKKKPAASKQKPASEEPSAPEKEEEGSDGS